ncbi:hypothetical protein [Nostoc sp. 'Lobaria pulmonaria (5183) cyanobiont']|uniref:hypothetical protein n=1 Tax=Nostoc sp. 'Lobaria pulmonaria (5183) cyanobiont' TaxID=1618022 RepID=UPI000CF30298|nr:hypothetical protein [Nostoc sp. 'Lobaria pulmonaria (5183) cyanobiont']
MKQKIQDKQYTTRMKESTLLWLEQESQNSGQSVAELIREGIEMLKKSRTTPVVEIKLADIEDPSELLLALKNLRKEVNQKIKEGRNGK